jgi:NitT/TauT family transport system substrate-binding protein
MTTRANARSWRVTRRAVILAAGLAAAALSAPLAQAQDTVRIGLPTKTYWPTIVAETALRQKLFQKEGIKAELTVYRGGAECFEALAAGAADMILNSASFISAGQKKGVMSRGVAGGHWPMAGTSSCARIQDHQCRRARARGRHHLGRLRLRHAGLVDAAGPQAEVRRCRSAAAGQCRTSVRNVDAVVPIAADLPVRGGEEVRSLIDFGAEVPPHPASAWIASDKIIKEAGSCEAVNALYGAVAFRRTRTPPRR